jgi:uncharacterized protein (TIGR02266 family)
MRERRSSGDFVLERRRTPRLPLRIEVSYSFSGGMGAGTTENLTVEGCFLRTDAPVPLDAAVEFVLDLPDEGGPVKAAGRVVRIARRKDDPLGFAVEFECLEESARARIAALVEQARIDLMARDGI